MMESEGRPSQRSNGRGGHAIGVQLVLVDAQNYCGGYARGKNNTEGGSTPGTLTEENCEYIVR